MRLAARVRGLSRFGFQVALDSTVRNVSTYSYTQHDNAVGVAALFLAPMPQYNETPAAAARFLETMTLTVSNNGIVSE